MRTTLLLTAAAAGALVLAGCTSGGGSSAAGGSGGGASPAAAAHAVAELKTSGSPLGTVVVNGKGRTVYAFVKDTTGSPTSACVGVCVPLWPALTTTSSTPSVEGVTGQLGTAPTADGREQVTLNGHRLYTFAGDSSAGQVNGQGYQDQWYVLSPSGTTIEDDESPAPSSSASGPTY